MRPVLWGGGVVITNDAGVLELLAAVVERAQRDAVCTWHGAKRVTAEERAEARDFLAEVAPLLVELATPEPPPAWGMRARRV